MKIIFLVVILILFNKSVASNIFETSYNSIEFVSNNIDDEKIIKINEIKEKSLLNILNKSLDNETYLKIIKSLNQDIINSFIKNIIINDEKIINDQYFSKIKINFDKKKIINYYRENKISYVEYIPKKILLIINEENELNANLFTINNNYYSYLIKNIKNHRSFKIPKLDINDRFILQSKDIKNKNEEKIINFSKKYNVDDVAVLIIDNKTNLANNRLYLYSNNKISKKMILYNNYDFKNFFLKLEIDTINLWKNLNKIQNENINFISCIINYFNIYELKEIRDNLNNISIIKNLNVKSIALKKVKYDIFYYGDLRIFKNILNINKLKINFDDNNCTLRLK